MSSSESTRFSVPKCCMSFASRYAVPYVVRVTHPSSQACVDCSAMQQFTLDPPCNSCLGGVSQFVPACLHTMIAKLAFVLCATACLGMVGTRGDTVSARKSPCTMASQTSSFSHFGMSWFRQEATTAEEHSSFLLLPPDWLPAPGGCSRHQAAAAVNSNQICRQCSAVDLLHPHAAVCCPQ